jgi:hypothetical protein
MAARTGDPMKTASPQATAVSQSAPIIDEDDDIPFQGNAQVAAAVEVAATPAAPPAENAKNILAMIRARQGQ